MLYSTTTALPFEIPFAVRGDIFECLFRNKEHQFFPGEPVLPLCSKVRPAIASRIIVFGNLDFRLAWRTLCFLSRIFCKAAAFYIFKIIALFLFHCPEESLHLECLQLEGPELLLSFQSYRKIHTET